jgi:hypothetical protein
MSILTVYQYSLRAGKIATFEAALREVSARAREGGESLHWTTAQAISGELTTLDIAFLSVSLAEAAARENPTALIERLFGEGRGLEMAARMGNCIAGIRSTMLRDRPDLSYPSQVSRGLPAGAVVLRAATRPGHQAECEILIRMIAEAIPKTEDIRRFTAWQPVMGDLSGIFTLRPVYDLDELDAVGPVSELLITAFGMESGRRIYREGLESIEQMESRLLRVREDLSHPKLA